MVRYKELGSLLMHSIGRRNLLASFEMYQLTFRYPIGPLYKDTEVVSSVQSCLRLILLFKAYFL